MALVLKSGRKRSSSLGALFVSNPKRKKRNPVKRKKRNPVKRRKNAAHKKAAATRKKNALALSRKRKNAAKKAAATRKRNALAIKRRKNALAIKRRKNALAMKRRKRNPRRRKNGTHKGQMRKTSRRAYMKRKNARRGKKRIIRRMMNPAMDIKLLKPITKPLKKIPLVKQLVPFIGASVFGMAVVVPYYYANDKISAYIQKSQLPAWVKKTDQYAGLFIGGLAVAAGSYWALNTSKLVSKSTAMNAARSIAILSGAAQFVKLKMMYDAGEIEIPFIGKKNGSGTTTTTTTTTAEETVEGLAYLADGMAYDVVPMAGMHANPHCMNGAHMAGMHMAGMHMYGDASMKDAVHAGHDLSHQELKAAMQGPMYWARCFGSAPHRASSVDGYSAYAGKHGHRWGWLIKVLGWDRFAKLCQMKAPDRIRAISRIKIACINASQKAFDSSKSMSGLAVDMGGLAYNSDSYSGLAMVGSVQ